MSGEGPHGVMDDGASMSAHGPIDQRWRQSVRGTHFFARRRAITTLVAATVVSLHACNKYI